MTVNNHLRKLNIVFLVFVAPYHDLARRRNKLSTVLLGRGNNRCFTSGGKLQAMTIVEGTTVTATMYFYYNASGIPVALKYNNVVYYYITNLQGDVVGIVGANGGIVVTYSYDAWGRPLSSTCAGNYDQPLMENNPLRYRGYIYDNETGFYYLQSRYYDPDVGRFINADSPEMALEAGITDENLYAYCDNNPVMRADDGGEIWNIVVGALVGAVTNVISDCISAKIEGKDFSEMDIFKSVLLGAAEGALTTICPAAAGFISAGISALDNLSDEVSKSIKNDSWDISNILISTANSALFAYVGADGGADWDDMNKVAKAAGTWLKSKVTDSVSRMAEQNAKKFVVKNLKKIGKSGVADIGKSTFSNCSSKLISWHENNIFHSYFGG